MRPNLGYNFEEAAAACGCSVRTIDQQVHDGNLITCIAGSETIIRHSDLANWLQGLPSTSRTSKTPIASTLLRSPEDVATDLGLKPTTLRRLCRQTDICTRLERDRIILSPEDVEAMRDHIKAHGTRAAVEAVEQDRFAS